MRTTEPARSRPTLLAGLLLQIRVISALLLRELHTRYGRENIGFLWVIGEPMIFCAGVAIVWTAIRPAHEHGIPVTAIVITGYVPLTMWRHCIARAIKAFDANGSLLFHRQVTPLDIITARVALEVMGAIVAGIAVTAGAVMIGYMKPPQDYGLIYLGLAYHSAFCMACALIVASLSERSEVVEKVIHVLMYLAIPLSGAFTMVEWLPQHYRWILLISPSVNNVEMIRAGQFGPTIHTHYNLFYNTWSTALMLLLGLSWTLRVRRHILVQ